LTKGLKIAISFTENSAKEIKSIFPAEASNTKVLYVGTPNEKYLWNSYLIKPVENMIHTDWILNVIHGFVDQVRSYFNFSKIRSRKHSKKISNLIT